MTAKDGGLGCFQRLFPIFAAQKSKRMKRFVVTSMLVADVLWCIASSGLRHFTTADGLLNNQVRQLVCLPCGQMFVATEGAFSLFDGGSFIVQECNLDSVLPLPVQGGHSYLLQATRCCG